MRFEHILSSDRRPLAGGVVLQRGALDLDVDALGQLLDGNTAPGGLVAGEVLLVHAVHAGKVGHVGQENVDLDDLVERAFGGLEDCSKVRENGFGLLLDRTGDNRPGLVGGDLARHKDEAVGPDRLGLCGCQWVMEGARAWGCIRRVLRL